MPARQDAIETPPANADDLRAQILQRHGAMSKRLKQIARYVLDEPNAVALETLAVLADRCGVQPSAIVRFAKSFGFDGATQMQRLFRDGLLARGATLDYAERVREFNRSVEGRAANDPAQVLGEFVEANLLALTHLRESIDAKALSTALGVAEPALFMNMPVNHALMPFPSSGRAGAAVSATRTSPLGSTYSQRGWSNPCAKAATCIPSAATGVPASVQPVALTTFKTGIRG